MRRLTFGLHPPFVHLVANTVVPHCRAADSIAVWGDTVNIASRIEAAGQPNRVLISAATAKHLDRDFKLDGPHKIETKEHRIIDTFFISHNN